MEGFQNIGLSVPDHDRLRDYLGDHNISVDKYVNDLVKYIGARYSKNKNKLREELVYHSRNRFGPIVESVIAHPRGDTYRSIVILASYHRLPISTFLRSAIRLHLEEQNYFISNPDRSLRPTEVEKQALYKPAPAYIGVRDKKVSFVDRNIEHDDSRSNLRSRLVAEQKRISLWLVKNWYRMQVDQRLVEHVQAYAAACGRHHAKLNVFTIDDEFRLIKKCIGEDLNALGEAGSGQWMNFERNHVILTSLYPEMDEYREALASLGPGTKLPEAITNEAISILEDKESQEIVAPEVPAHIRERFESTESDDAEASQKRTYDVAALTARTGGAIWQLIETVPKVEKASVSATALWSKYWPHLKEIIKWMGWI